MPCPAFFRRAIRSLTTVGVCLALSVTLLPTVANAAEPAISHLTAAKRDVIVGGVAYNVRLTVTQWGSDEDVSVAVKRVADPDGEGVLRSVQTSAWSFMPVDSLSIGADRRSASVDTGTQLSPFGTVSFAFTATKPEEKSCRGDKRVSRGKLVGGLTLNTRTPLGVISLGNLRGALTTIEDPRCDFPMGGMPCPKRGDAIAAVGRGGSTMLSAWRRTGAPQARVMALAMKQLTADDPDLMVGRVQMVTSRLAPDRLRLREDLDAGVLRGAAGTFMRGRAVFTGSGTTNTESGRCGTGAGRRQVTVNVRRGQLAGTFLVDFLTGRDLEVGEQRLMSFAANLTLRRI